MARKPKDDPTVEDQVEAGTGQPGATIVGRWIQAPFGHGVVVEQHGSTLIVQKTCGEVYRYQQEDGSYALVVPDHEG